MKWKKEKINRGRAGTKLGGEGGVEGKMRKAVCESIIRKYILERRIAENKMEADAFSDSALRNT